MRPIHLATLVLALLGSAMPAPLAADAQQADRVWRVGWLGNGSRAAREANTLTPLREGLRELGYVEGKNLVIDARWSDGDDDRLTRDAADLVRVNVDVIVTHGTVGGVAARKATAAIPIVIATASNLVGTGLVTSLAHPGGNVTGTSDQAGELVGKSLDVIAEVLPGLQRVAVLWYRENPSAAQDAKALQGAARRRGLSVTSLAAAGQNDVARLIDTGLRDRARGLIVVQDAWSLANRASIISLATAKRVPVFATSRLYAESGALVSYGADIPAVYKRAAVFIDRILRGAKPADIPVEQPTKFEMVINLRTARALGLAIPPSLLLRSDQVID